MTSSSEEDLDITEGIFEKAEGDLVIAEDFRVITVDVLRIMSSLKPEETTSSVCGAHTQDATSKATTTNGAQVYSERQRDARVGCTIPLMSGKCRKRHTKFGFMHGAD